MSSSMYWLSLLLVLFCISYLSYYNVGPVCEFTLYLLLPLIVVVFALEVCICDVNFSVRLLYLEQHCLLHIIFRLLLLLCACMHLMMRRRSALRFLFFFLYPVLPFAKTRVE